ncbi:MAG: DUF2834 domain-containing protein [Thalassovita sp.]
MTRLRWVFLAAAVWGAIHPMWYFVQWFDENGLNLPGMIDAWHVNAASSGLVWDLTIAAFTLTIWIVIETLKTKRWSGLWAIPATYFVGVSCGLPLFLFIRSRPTRVS